MTTSDTGAILRKLQTQDPSSWSRELCRAFPGRPGLVRECLARLVSTRERERQDEGAYPRLGGPADQRFQILRRIDVGATADVFMARDARLKRNVAIKLFRHESSTVQQALDEAKLAADVVSEHVIRVLDVGDEGCRPYIVMELVAERRATRVEDPDDDTLELGWSAATAQGRPRSIDEAVRWTIDVARGVQTAHARDVFHRDIKPQNVLISPVHRKARVTDFGLGIGLATSSGSQLIVASGDDGPVTISGTPEYMAPEQARGLLVDLDARNHIEHRATLIAVDVWGLGALLDQLLSDHPPWSASADEEAWEQARHATPPPLPDRVGGKRISWRLRWIIKRAMAPEPKDRHPSPAALALELENVLAHKPTSLDGSMLRRAELWVRRNPQLAATAISALVCAMLFVASYVGVRQLRAERDDLDKQVTMLAAKVPQLERKVPELEKNVSVAGRLLDRTNRELRDKTAQLERKEYELLESQQMVKEEQKWGSARLQRVFAERDVARAEVALLKEEIRNQGAQDAQLRREMVAVTTERNVVGEKLERTTQSLGEVTAQRDAARMDLASAQKSLKSATKERAAAIEELIRMKNTLRDLEAQRNDTVAAPATWRGIFSVSVFSQCPPPGC